MFQSSVSHPVPKTNPKRGLLEKKLLPRSKFIPFRVDPYWHGANSFLIREDPNWQGRQNPYERFASLASVSILLKSNSTSLLRPGSVAQWSGGREFEAPVQQHSFVETDHEIFSTVILSLPLIQEGKLSVTCKRMCTEYWLTA